ncbi:MAG: anthranilate phosphoribosyltransferase [Saprospiraceae bacterium]|jgi:anthranilate phosphoribosyltransferase|nr:anthranilate phosphoribosyltransferase [Saprospiraceae bacterium]MBK6477882.1 anthranilate phosphoribosyltransferase [Saprospiraceae bacterium]MBK6816244.1 anthranilate phosphoribosyltransferase [Saprospiraceae bacterium]MBK7370355.1 anthranilate phosphoribosyltransferase [Saprospiraceae bacterium]MBK7438064.1 anthranilate phosphoribosyltransferase [Saprospiraceae bacterium]
MKKILTYLYEHKKLNRVEAREILVNISRNAYNEAQVASFITVYLMRAISEHELQGFVDALLDLCIPVDLDGLPTIDLCGTGGDGKNTFNISTLSSFVVAGAGYKVTKHGNYGVSSKCGSSDLLETLGYKFTNDVDVLRRQLDKSNICFLHAPMFHPAMKSVAPIRKQLGVKTFFNMLGPLVNPARPKYQMAGVFNLELARLYAYLFQQQPDKRFSVIHAMDGYDEISLTGSFKMKTQNSDVVLQPGDLGLKTLKPDEIYGGDTKEDAAAIFNQVLNGVATPAQMEVVYANAGIAIHTADPSLNLVDAVQKARESISNGQALSSFKNLLEATA